MRSTVTIRLSVADHDALADLLRMLGGYACDCDEPPYRPDEGESGQVECPWCVAKRMHRAFEKGQVPNA